MPAQDPSIALIDRILAQDALTVAFQPIVQVSTGDVFGYEVLGRVRPLEGLETIPGPGELLEVAHRSGRLLRLDREWRHAAIKRIGELATSALPVFFLNVDPRIVEADGFTRGFTESLLEKYKLPADRFVLELTETGSALHDARLAEIVKHYAEQGFRIALDDVGAGFASLTALVSVRPQFIKLDKALVNGISKDSLRLHLVQSLIEFGRRAQIHVIAEGIETEPDLLALMRAGIVFGQGYLLGRPAPAPQSIAANVREMIQQVHASAEGARFRSIRTDPIGSLLRDIPTLSPSALCEQVERVFKRDPEHVGYPVTDASGTTLGLVMRDRFLLAMSGPFGYALNARREVTDLMDKMPLRVDERVPLEEVSRLVTARDASRLYDLVLVERNGRCIGAVTVHTLLSRVTELEVQHATYASPLTGLPGNVVIDHEIRRALSNAATSGVPATFVYCDIDNFKAFNDVYGFAAGDEVIQLTASALRLAFHADMFEDVFVGHIGGDDFVVAVVGDGSVDEACERTARIFDERVRTFYSPADLLRAGIFTHDRRGEEAFFPIATLSMAVVTHTDLAIADVREVARVAAQLKHRAKQSARDPGARSRWVRERRLRSSPPASAAAD